MHWEKNSIKIHISSVLGIMLFLAKGIFYAILYNII